MPLTNINLDWMSNASSGLCIILLYYIIYAGPLSCILGCNYAGPLSCILGCNYIILYSILLYYIILYYIILYIYFILYYMSKVTAPEMLIGGWCCRFTLAQTLQSSVPYIGEISVSRFTGKQSSLLLRKP